MVPTIVRRAFVTAWIVLGVAGALDHTIAQKLFGRRFDLQLPNLRYGHVMFNTNLRTVRVFEYATDDGVRHPLADLMETPAIGYSDARMSIDLLTSSDYLAEVCLRAFRASHAPLTFFGSEYQVDVDPRRPTRTLTLRCDAHGLSPR